MSDTSRTDAARVWPLDAIPTDAEKARRYIGLARTLERELSAKDATIAELREALVTICAMPTLGSDAACSMMEVANRALARVQP